MARKRRLLVTGASGLLGRHVAALAAAAGWQVLGTYHRAQLDLPGVDLQQLALPDGIEALIADLRPDAVIHTAYTREAAVLWPVIVAGSAAVARGCASAGARLIHMSSDAIFAGRERPYAEADDPEPIFTYGAAKAAAEAVVSALYPPALMVRTSLIYTAPGAASPDPFLEMALRLLRDPSQGALFTDELRCPICVDDLAAALLELVDLPLSGVLNVAGPEPLSRYEFARLQLIAAGYDPSGLPSGSAAAIRRPTRVALDSLVAVRSLRTRLRSPHEVLVPR